LWKKGDPKSTQTWTNKNFLSNKYLTKHVKLLAQDINRGKSNCPPQVNPRRRKVLR
jgi:hypothetical protein